MKKNVVKKLLALVLLAALTLTVAVPALAAGTGFSDVAETDWYAEAVSYCAKNGLLQGYTDGSFGPGVAVSRGAVVTVLHRVAGTPTTASAAPFSDVAETAWYAEAAAWAYTAAVADGYADGSFAPEQDVTREQLTAFLYRAYGSPAVSAALLAGLDKFPDADSISAWAKDSMAWAVSAGLLSGYTDGRLYPRDTANRAQLAVLLQRYHALPGYENVLDVIAAPVGLVKTAQGSLLVTDSYNKVIWSLEDGTAKLYAGADTPEDLSGQPVGGYNDAELTASYFRSPWAIVPFLDGYAVSDPDNDVVRLVQGGRTATVNGSTWEPLKVTALGVAFSHPTGLAVDEEGSLYVSDTWNGAVRKVTAKGRVTTVASGLEDPTGLCWKDGVLYIAETGANRICKIAGNTMSIVAGSGECDYADGSAVTAAFAAPQGVAVDDKGAVYVADTGNSAVRVIKDGTVSTLCIRDWGSEALCPVAPMGLLLDGSRLYVCDEFARRVFTLTVR